MTAAVEAVAHIRRDMIKLERRQDRTRQGQHAGQAARLGRASDLLTQARGCELYRLR